MSSLIPLPIHTAGRSPIGARLSAPQQDLTPLKRLIWAYFWLLILEGALRKWLLPGYSNPLLIVRDPIVIAIYALAMWGGLFPMGGFIFTIAGLAFLSAGASLVGPHCNFFVTLYGVRTDFLHLPLVFILPRVFDWRDVEKIGKWLLILAFPMALLVVAQFRAAPDARVNAGAGGVIGGQILIGAGRIRPPGTFSYNTGLLAYLMFAAAYLLNTQIGGKLRSVSWGSKLALVSFPAVAIMVAVSGSRTTLVSLAIVLAGFVFITLKRRAFFRKGMQAIMVLGIAFAGLLFWPEFREGLTVHQDRFAEAGGFQEGIFTRILDGVASPLRAVRQAPFLGYGLGMGTNAAAGMLTGDRGFLLAEEEWERIVMESGPLLGFGYIALRIALIFYVGRIALRSLNSDNALPALLFAAALPPMLNGEFSVPTTLGFTVFTAGCALAAANREGATVDFEGKAASARTTAPQVKVRGRSIYAEQLHGK